MHWSRTDRSEWVKCGVPRVSQGVVLVKRSWIPCDLSVLGTRSVIYYLSCPAPFLSCWHWHHRLAQCSILLASHFPHVVKCEIAWWKSSWPHSSSEIMWNRSWNLVLRHPLSSPVIGSIPSLPLLPFPSVCIMLLGEKLIFSLLNHGSEVSYFAVFVFVSDQNHCRP